MSSVPGRAATAAQPLVRCREWPVIKKWPGLRGEDMVAWLFLWELSGQRSEAVIVTATEIGADQGKSSDAGRRRLTALVLAGLATSSPIGNGRYLVTLLDPFEAAKARRIEIDPQPDLPFEAPAAHEGPAQAAHAAQAEPSLLPMSATNAFGPGEDREARRGSAGASAERGSADPRSDALALADGLPFKALASASAQSEEKEAQAKAKASGNAQRGSAGISAAQELGISQLGDLVRGMVIGMRNSGEFQTPLDLNEGQKAERIKALGEQLLKQIGDAKMDAAIVAKIATDVVERRLPLKALTEVLARMEAKRRSGELRSPSAYINGTMPRKYLELGISWRDG